MSYQAKFEIPRNTPLVKIDNVYFKCEFGNPTGSHKDRAVALQITKLQIKKISEAVISSSGNAAISAAYYCKLAGIKLNIFISPNINKNKLEALKEIDCEIFQTPKPISASIKFARENNAFNLRQSTDPNALIGYESIAKEIIQENVVPDAFFIPVSSASSLVGIALGIEKLGYRVPIHAVQTDAVHPISGMFDKDFQVSERKSLADAIVARYTPRESAAIKIIRQTDGWGWTISNSEMEKGRSWLLSHNLDCSYEGAATIAALWKAEKKGYKFKNPICLLTGKFY